MRLLRLTPPDTFCLTDDLDDDDPHTIPRYFILSHTWGPDNEEVTFDDIRNGSARDKIGYAKLKFCAERAVKDHIYHFWIDTCCIKKTSDSELSQAIRSMFRWYQNAVKCYVFLVDVSSSERDTNGGSSRCWEKSIQSSRWFTRGWTLQELLAPLNVEFFSREGVSLGSKAKHVREIQEITGIPATALCGRSVLDFSVEERFAWAEKRQTKKVEDQAYCLFGIFNIQLPVLYGEGRESAMRRLKKEVGITPRQIDEAIQKRYNDGRRMVERLSGKSLPLECCFVNLGIINHIRDSDTRMASNKSITGQVTKPVSMFSLAARLKVEAPLESHQVSLSTLFEPRKQIDGTHLRPNRVLVWGRAGMGKTTLCKKIVYEVYKNGLWKDLYDRVIWLPLRRLKRSESRTTVELLENEFSCTRLGEQTAKALEELVHNQRTLFLLDGLDEVSLALDQDSTEGRLLHELLSRSHVIITSRPHSTHVLYHQPPDLELETVGFFPQQIEEYLQQVAKETDKAKTTIEEIRSFIQQRPLIRSLAGIPIQLDAICYTWNAKTFPRDSATMTNLYLAISQSLWKNSALRLEKTGDDGKLVTRRQLDYWTWRYFKKFIQAEIEFLQELAFRGLCEEIIEFGVEDTEILGTSQQMPGDKIIHLAFLRVSDSSVDIDDRTFHFIHLTFQEFFAAQYFVSHWTYNRALSLRDGTMHGRLSDQPSEFVTPKRFVQSRKYVDRYNIFWRFVVGLLRIEQDQKHLCRFLDTLESEPIDLVGLAHQRLVIHCLSELSPSDNDLHGRFRQLEDRYLQWCVCESMLSRSWNRQYGRYGRYKSMSLIGEAECSDYILKRLLNEKETEKEVLDVLFRRSSISSKLLDAVIQKLRESASEAVQRTTIQIIGQHCGHDQKAKILNLFQSKQCSRIPPQRIFDAWIDTSRLLEPAVETLTELLQDPERYVRSSAANILGRQATLPSTAIMALIQLLQDPEGDVRSSARISLRRKTTLPSTAIKALIRLLQDPEKDVRSGAADILGLQATLPSTAIEALIQLLQDPKRAIRHSAMGILSRQATLPSTAIETLVQLLQDPEVGLMATFSLQEQAALPSTAIEALIQLLQNPETGDIIWTNVTDVLRRQATLPSTAIEALVQLLQDPTWDVRICATSSLERQATLPSKAIEAVIQLLQDPYEDIRSTATDILGRQATLPSTAIEPLIKLLQDPFEDVRSNAAASFRGQATLPSTAIEPLIKLLQDRFEDVRSSAAYSLGGQATLPSTAIEALIQLLQDPEENVRSNAADSLRGQATLPSTAIEAVIQLLQDPYEDIRSTATDILRRQATLPSTAIEPLIQLLQDPEENVQYSAWRILSEQATLPSTAIETLVQLLQDPEGYVRFGATITLGGQATLPSTAIEALIQLLQDPEGRVRSSAADILGRQATLPSTAIEPLIRLLRDPEGRVRSRAEISLGRQTTLSSTAVEALIQLLQDLGTSATEEALHLITSRQEIRSLAPAFSSSVFQAFIKHWFSTGSVICFIEKDCFCVSASEQVQKISVEQHQLEQFRVQWLKARDDIGLPARCPRSSL
ncbi:hypothetical protein LTR67_011298 [Exophiala xenobiotica]